MKQKTLSLLLILLLLCPVFTVAASAAPSEEEAYSAIMAQQARYPEGMRWTNENSYAWHGGIYSIGFGCAGFAFLLSDAAFGTLPARLYRSFAYADIRVGDILRLYGDTHSVVVLKITPTACTIAEGNMNESVHWGRVLQKNEVMTSTDYIITRYPEGQAHVHHYAKTVTSPLCTAQGYTTYTCICGNRYIADYVAALGHRWDRGEILTPPVGDEPGTARFTCERCGLERVTSVFCMGDEGCASHLFRDAPPIDSWAHEGVDYGIESGLFAGTSASSFSPTGTMTRAMLVSVLWRMSDKPEPQQNGGFRDVAAGTWYTDAVSWAVEAGIASGTGDGRFAPDDPVTREQIACILQRYAARNGQDNGARADLDTFPDCSAVSPWATDALSFANAAGLITGAVQGSHTVLAPQGLATREQVVSILMRYQKAFGT